MASRSWLKNISYTERALYSFSILIWCFTISFQISPWGFALPCNQMFRSAVVSRHYKEKRSFPSNHVETAIKSWAPLYNVLANTKWMISMEGSWSKRSSRILFGISFFKGSENILCGSVINLACAGHHFML